MFLIDGGFCALTVLRVNGETALEGDGVVVLIRLTREDEILLRRQLTVETVDAEVYSVCSFFHRREQQLRLAYRHCIDRTDGFFTLCDRKHYELIITYLVSVITTTSNLLHFSFDTHKKP